MVLTQRHRRRSSVGIPSERRSHPFKFDVVLHIVHIGCWTGARTPQDRATVVLRAVSRSPTPPTAFVAPGSGMGCMWSGCSTWRGTVVGMTDAEFEALALI